MKSVTKIVIQSSLVLMSFLTFSSHGQICVSNITSTSPTTSFSVNNDGTVIDNKTGIMWYRCSIGQNWDSATNQCVGGAEQVNWQQALQLANDFNGANHSDWQLPSVKELASIVERQCVDPALNVSIFPSSIAQNYWTGTSGVGSSTSAWAVAFYSGKTNLRSKLSDVHVRVMRYAK